MPQSGASPISTMLYVITLVWLVTLNSLSGTAYGDTLSFKSQNPYYQTINEQFNLDAQCTDLWSDNAFCGIRTELRYHRYLNTPRTSHERFSSVPIERDQPRTDLLAVFKLAMEEFDLLSGVRIYYAYTEKNIEQWAIKLRLKGEISISNPNFYTDGHAPRATIGDKSKASAPTRYASNKPSFFKPTRIKWNIGLNPDDMTLYGDIQLNPYLRINGAFGDENQVGLFFSYHF